METIKQIMQKQGVSSARDLTRQSSSNCLTRTTDERRELLLKYNPSAQTELTRDEDDCFFGSHPSLAKLQEYGPNVPQAWLVGQLYDLCEYTSVQKMDEQQAKACASVLAKEAYHLKLTELMVFFQRVKAGRYGKFYGKVDSIDLGVMLQSFMKERASTCDRRERAENVARIDEERANACRYEDYLKRRGLPEDYSPFKHRGNDLQNR